jgi:hypothetical protein
MSLPAIKLNPRQLTVCLSAALVIRASCSFAQEENYVGYRHEFYREDDNRMSIDTDTAGIDVGLGEHVRLNGQVVQDAISGATPTGAPPQTQWPFPTFKTYYNKAYAPLFQAAVNDPNNLILYQSGYFANYQAYTNYIAANNPQIATQATNNARASYKALTSNPTFHSTTVPLTHLTDLRNAFSLGVPITFGIQQITPQISDSEEHDYHSLGMSLNYSILLNQKNTTVNAGWSHDSDSVRDDTLVNWQDKVTDDFSSGG